MTVSKLRGRRSFLRNQVPFLLGRNYDRVAPSHVLNGFLCAAFGPNPSAKNIRVLLRNPDLLPEIPSIAASILEDPQHLSRFRQAMGVVLNADRRLFPSGGSVFPVSLGMVSQHLMDDGFGSEVWELACACDRNLSPRIRSFFGAPIHGDVLGQLGSVLCGDISACDPKHSRTKPPWDSELGATYARKLAALLSPAFAEAGGFAMRSSRLIALSSGCFAIGFLATLRSAEITHRRPKTWSDLSPMFVFGGMPPGRANDPATRLASKSFATVVAAQRDALREILVKRLKRRRVPASTPKTQYARVVVAGAFPDASDKDQELARDAVGRVQDAEKVADRLADALYPAGFLDRGFRRVGRKLGLAGPDRGFGSPRFLLETPALALLSAATVPPGNSIGFRDWLDEIFLRFGIILGPGQRTDCTALLAHLDTPGVVTSILRENQEALRRRMVRAGLAMEYSDGETEVVSPERRTD